MDNNDVKNLASLFTEKVDKKMDMEEKQTATLSKAAGEGPEAVKDLETPVEYDASKKKETGNEKPVAMKMKNDVKTEGVSNMIKSSFDQLFSNTINEQDEMFDDTEDFGDEESLETGEDIDSEISDEDVGEEVDVATRLEMILDDLTSVISAIRGESEEGEEDFEDEGVEDDFGGENDFEGQEFGEAVSQPEPKSFSDAGGKKMMGKGNIKVKGTAGKTAPAKGALGTFKNQPEPKSFPDTGKKMVSKSNIKVKSSLKPGQPSVS